MGIQLGLTESGRCKLPEGTDGTGYWILTVHALGYQDYVVKFQAKAENIAKPAGDDRFHTTGKHYRRSKSPERG